MKKEIIAALLVMGLFCLSIFKIAFWDNTDTGIVLCSDLSDDFN